ncbi:extracellular solute-binding protein [Stella sp.]|uniref:extracellular solute-binding protein n=1 Tax=Stella sp. TaxID=2912054 RepID=UPI0035B2DE87
MATDFGWTRRGVLGGAAALAGTAAAGRIARAAACSRVVVGTWGGDYQRLLTANIEKPLTDPQGLETVHDVGTSSARKTKLLAGRASRRGAMDIACLSDLDTYEMNEAGVLAPIDLARVPSHANLIKPLVRPFAIAHIYSAKVIVYNPTKIPAAPQSFNDLWDPKYKGRVGLVDGHYAQNIESAALVNGGSMSNYEPGKAKLLELKTLVEPKVYPSNEALAAALKSEEVWITLMFKARGFMWKKAGIPVECATPKEGATPYISDMAVVKNAENLDCAWRYMEAMLRPEAQVGFADRMGYLPTVTNAKLPPDLEKEIGFSEAEIAAFNLPDYGYVAKNAAPLLEWWNKSFKG